MFNRQMTVTRQSGLLRPTSLRWRFNVMFVHFPILTWPTAFLGKQHPVTANHWLVMNNDPDLLSLCSLENNLINNVPLTA